MKSTKAQDYFLTITESKKRMDDKYERFKIFIYKEDFNKFIEALKETINHVKTELMPNYDFDEYDRRQEEYEQSRQQLAQSGPPSAPATETDEAPAPVPEENAPPHIQARNPGLNYQERLCYLFPVLL